VGPQGRSEQVRKISPPPGFDPRTVQPVASRYTDHATRPTNITNVQVLILKLMIVGGVGGGLPRTAKHGHDTRLYISQKIKE